MIHLEMTIEQWGRCLYTDECNRIYRLKKQGRGKNKKLPEYSHMCSHNTKYCPPSIWVEKQLNEEKKNE